jgi:predicted nucleic acid-binding protein
LRLYAESSSVLAWLLGEVHGDAVVRALADTDAVFASELTLVECERVLIRALHLGEIKEADLKSRQAEILAVSAAWTLLSVSDEVLERARRPFPAEPVRTLDALHLASALIARGTAPEFALLSLDDRIRRNGRALGLALAPPDPAIS